MIFFRLWLDDRNGSDRLLTVSGDEHALRDFDVDRISGAVGDVFVKREPSRGVEKIGTLVADVSQARVRDRPALWRFESAFVFKRQRQRLSEAGCAFASFAFGWDDLGLCPRTPGVDEPGDVVADSSTRVMRLIVSDPFISKTTDLVSDCGTNRTSARAFSNWDAGISSASIL